MVRAIVAPGGAITPALLAASLCLSSVAPTAAADDTGDLATAPPATPSSSTVVEPMDAGAWAATELGDVRAVASDGTRFVAVGSAGYPPEAAAWSSTDGLAWDPDTVADAPSGSTLTAVVPTDAGFMALGHESSGDGGTADRVIAWHSADGITWEPATVERPGDRQLQAVVSSVANGPAGALALGSFIGQDLGRQRLWHSVDGLTWEPVALPGSKGSIWSSVAAIPGGYLLLGQSTRGRTANWRSSDGMTWKRLKDSPRIFDVASTPDGTTVGIGSKAIWLSPDLRTWERVWTRPPSWDLHGSNAFEWVEWDGGEYLVVGHDYGNCPPNTDECHRNPLLVSPDGRTWSEAAGPDGQAGADAATWLEGSASSGGTTIVEGQTAGTDVVWLVTGELVPAGASGLVSTDTAD